MVKTSEAFTTIQGIKKIELVRKTKGKDKLKKTLFQVRQISWGRWEEEGSIATGVPPIDIC